jgi:hypothetical protein
VALKVGEGYDHYNAQPDFLTRSGFLQWQFPNSAPLQAFSFVTGLAAIGKALYWGVSHNIGAPDQTVSAVWADRNQEAFIGFRVNLPFGSSLTVGFVDTIGGATQCSVFFNSANYAVYAYRGDTSGTLLGVSPNNAWTGATNQFFEFRVKVANSGGVLEVRKGNVVILTVSGVDTQQTANAWHDRMDLGLPGALFSNVYATIDDLYYCDTTSDPGATPNNTYLGDVGTRTLFTTGDGTVQWTPNSGANNYSRVAETAMDSDTSYNATATPGNEDRLSHQPIVNVIALIYGVQVTIAARKDDVGPRVLKTGLKSGATTSYGANHSLPDSYAYFTDMWILDPNTSANWTRTAVNNVQSIYNLVS